MTIQRILVPLDGTRPAERALGQAIRIAHDSGASILLLNVLSPRTGSCQQTGGDLRTARMGAYLRDRRSLLWEMGYDAEFAIEEGEVVERIVTVSRQWGADLIVMASGREGCPDSVDLGPTLYGVVDGAPVSTMIVPPTGLAWLVELETSVR